MTESNYAKKSYESAGFYNVEIVRTRVFDLPQFTDMPIDVTCKHIIVPSTKRNKGFKKVLEVIKSLKSDQYHFDIFGGITDDILSLSAQNATFHGIVARHEYLEKLAGGHFLLNLSFCDAGPRAIIEAASYGLNIISTKNGIAPELAKVYSRTFIVDSPNDVIHILNNITNSNFKHDTGWKELFYDSYNETSTS